MTPLRRDAVLNLLRTHESRSLFFLSESWGPQRGSSVGPLSLVLKGVRGGLSTDLGPPPLSGLACEWGRNSRSEDPFDPA